MNATDELKKREAVAYFNYTLS